MASKNFNIALDWTNASTGQYTQAVMVSVDGGDYVKKQDLDNATFATSFVLEAVEGPVDLLIRIDSIGALGTVAEGTPVEASIDDSYFVVPDDVKAVSSVNVVITEV